MVAWLLLAGGGAAWGQAAAGSALVLQIGPEARLEPARLTLRFQIAPDGSAPAGETVTVTAWIRTLPGQAVRLRARLGSLSGPGSAAASGVAWSGAALRASGGAAAASCAGGVLSASSGAEAPFGAAGISPGAAAEPVAGWTGSGTLACALTFKLLAPGGLPPGWYAAVADLTLEAR